jgi:hypothetical protein
MKNIFNSIQLKKPKRNYFDLTHDVKMSANMGELTPILTLECVPGDQIELGCESIIRFAPMVAPVMHRIDVTMHYFFVPNRILWDNWEQYITNNGPVGTGPDIAPPTITITEGATSIWGRFLDYMGIPPVPGGRPGINVNALPFAAYQCIYNEYYRDQNLIAPVNYKLIDGDNNAFRSPLLDLRYRAWEHDYFTASLPFAQKGAAVDIPLGAVSGDARILSNRPGNTILTGSPYNAEVLADFNAGVDTDLWAQTDGLNVEPTTINDLRRAYRLQEWLEKNARGGTRYIESILSHFGVKSPDARLQRPEYITGVKTPVVISEVLNTSGAVGEGELPQGNMAGHGISVSSGKSGSYYCQEHGYIIGIMSVMPKTAYQQGIPRTYLKLDPLDYFWPSFANIGEQEVKNAELYAYHADQEETFGYVPRYAEYKYMPSRVAGDFRNTLDYWHLGRIFAEKPELNQAFIECDPDSVARIFAVEDPDAQKLYCHVLNKIKAVRPMPKYGTPTI